MPVNAKVAIALNVATVNVATVNATINLNIIYEILININSLTGIKLPSRKG